MDRSLFAGTKEEEQSCRSSANSNNDITTADLHQQKLQQTPGSSAASLPREQQAHWKAERSHVMGGYPSTACYFRTARVEALTLSTHLEVLFKVHLKGNKIFSRAAYCRTENGILIIVIQLITYPVLRGSAHIRLVIAESDPFILSLPSQLCLKADCHAATI